MLGAVIGDICGSPYEFIEYDVPYNFPLLVRGCTFTDDTVLTMAVADSLLECYDSDNETMFKKVLVDNLKQYGRAFHNAGYGGRFIEWIWDTESKPYNSFGNGSAMRVSPVGWVFDDLETTRKFARWSAEVTHNHPEGVKAAECTASVIFLARTGHDLNYIEQWVKTNFNYNIYDIPQSYYVSCQTTMPICLKALYDSRDFESALRNAISYGHDTDTYGAITGSMAEALYGLDKKIVVDAIDILPDVLVDVLIDFLEIRRKRSDGLRDM